VAHGEEEKLMFCLLLLLLLLYALTISATSDSDERCGSYVPEQAVKGFDVNVALALFLPAASLAMV
jgi:hypothetical protein